MVMLLLVKANEVNVRKPERHVEFDLSRGGKEVQVGGL